MSDAVLVAIITLIGTLAPIMVTIITSANKTAKKIDTVESKLDQHIKEDEWSTAKQTRVRILRFNDEICGGVSFSESHWEDILEDIDLYEEFCNSHPDFHNNKGQMAMNNIKTEYLTRKKTNNFLIGGTTK